MAKDTKYARVLKTTTLPPTKARKVVMFTPLRSVLQNSNSRKATAKAEAETEAEAETKAEAEAEAKADAEAKKGKKGKTQR